jgi:dolichol-phosphate mannosyltransferase
LTQFSIVIPTLNEADNIDPLLTRLFSLDLPKNSFEVIIVDDGSIDGTPGKVRAWESQANVRLIERREKPGLTDSVRAGVASAQGNVIVVMDADLSHPPERLPALVAPVLEGSHDLAIGSRYVSGGGTEGWPLRRQWLSRLAGSLARALCDVNDVTSGFFAFRRELAATIAQHARGSEILLELLMAGQGKLSVIEVPIRLTNRTTDRTRSTSKLSFSHHWTYLQRLMTLAGGTASAGSAGRFAAAGLFGVLIDALVFQLLMSTGAGVALAHITSFFAAATVNYALNSKKPFRLHREPHPQWRQFSRFVIVGVFALLMRGGLLALLIYEWHMPPFLAIFPAIAATAVINYLGSAFYILPVEQKVPSADIRWRVASFGIIAFSILLRLIYIGTAELFPDEAYYWNYSQHMDLSFYDHPPMVAWLIWLGTSIFGNSEFAVRFGAFCCGLITMGYMYALARNLYDKPTAIRTLLLLAVLPFYFATGAVMTADAPLVAAWAATLYYMERALVANRVPAWLGMGIAFGLGILSKYTLALLGLAALVFVIVDPTSRRWLIRPHPYLAAALALLLFSPVIIWNMEHSWASLTFQSSRIKGVGDDQFGLHELILHLMVLLTPVGLLAAILAFLSMKNKDHPDARRRLFIMIFAGVPLAVFVVLSIFDTLRFHWTGPVWLGILPTIAWMMGRTDDLRPVVRWLRSAWSPTIAICLFLYAFVLHYLVLGIPGIPYQGIYSGFPEHYFWREATKGVEKIVDEVRQQTGQEPIVIGMTKWSIASILTFYNRGKPMEIRSRNMFGDSGAMYDFWYPSEPSTARPIILVGMWSHNLERTRDDRDIGNMLVDPGPVQDWEVMQDGKPLRQVYYRIAQGYLGKQNVGKLK